ncbi:MAG: sulfotransferase family protein [Casimicrobiaceae bacterium]
MSRSGGNGMQGNVQYQSGSPLHSRRAGSYVFVVSHMRSFSSLLCHILGSHPEISGYAEAHLSYFSRLDLQRLARKVQELTGNPVLGKYVLDKVLHNHREIAPAILERPEIKVLFLLRNAEDTISSILSLGRAGGGKGKFSEPVHVLNYYSRRLRQLGHYGRQLGGKALFLESERLLTDTDQVLQELSRWLGLGEGLKGDYRTFPLTGAPGYGDPSPNILAGKIVRNAEERHRHCPTISIPGDLVQQAVAAHAACREGLARHRIDVPA